MWRLEIIALSMLCCALSLWVRGKEQRRLLRLTIPQIHAQAKAGKLRTSIAGTLIAILGIVLGFYAMFWL
jgi:hypothetical protein